MLLVLSNRYTDSILKLLNLNLFRLWNRVLRRDALRTQKPTEGTGQKSLLLWRKPMAQVTYRGVEYDTEEYRKMLIDEHTQTRNHDLMYRGIKVRSGAKACS